MRRRGGFAGRVTQGGYPSGFPQIRTCPFRHPARHLMTSLRCSPYRGPRGRGEDCTAPPVERIWTTALSDLGDAQTTTVARFLVLPPGNPGA